MRTTTSIQIFTTTKPHLGVPVTPGKKVAFLGHQFSSVYQQHLALVSCFLPLKDRNRVCYGKENKYKGKGKGENTHPDCT